MPMKMPGTAIWIACAFGIVLAGVSVMQASATSLKPIDQATLKSALDTTARDLMVPGAMVLLRTPQGEFIVSYGTTELGAAT
ncbi:MAG TPA: hypothetical protein VIZ17_11660, partial [Acetobacteraceae bacterium]